jgi:hypothetical protein
MTPPRFGHRRFALRDIGGKANIKRASLKRADPWVHQPEKHP